MRIRNSKSLFRLFIAIGIFSIGFHQAVIGQNSWRFAVLGDTHVGSSDTIAEMIPFMQADGIDCILVCGDIVEGGLACSGPELHAELLSWRTILQPLYNSGIGVYPILGNHEDDAQNTIAVWNSVFSGAYTLPQNGPSGEQNLTYSFNHKNALFVGLDDYVSIHKINQNWLNQQLAANTLPHVFVFGHEAAFKVFHADCLDDSVSARDQFWQSLAQSNAKTYFCGHDHFLDVSKVDDGDGNENNDVYQYVVGTGGGWLMPQYSNYNGTNSTFTPNRIFHDMEFGYALVEVSGEGPNDCDVTITWKKRTWNSTTLANEYLPTASVIHYSSCTSTGTTPLSEKNISVYPNPTSDNIRVSGISGLTVIYNCFGGEVWNGHVEQSKEIAISAFSAGIYFIRNETLITKFIVTKP